MCGILGVISLRGREPSLDDQAVIRLRDLMTSRGPDDAGLWRERNVILAHRRLAVIDPTPDAAQPMTSADGRFVIVYNGELYNDEELRSELAKRGHPDRGFRTRCDTETLLEAFACWGTGAFARLRGMFACAIYDRALETLTLARDPLGIKPLYLWSDARELLFASDLRAILHHPLVSARPNMEMVSAYLTTIRHTIENDTLFEGVHALAPGQIARCTFSGSAPTVSIVDYHTASPVDPDFDDAALPELLRAAVHDSVRRHLRADVPTCALLSGGVDSAIITRIARDLKPDLRTYCAGALPEAGEPESDLHHARRLAAELRTSHSEAIIDRDVFAEAWPGMIGAMGMPLSTPNEVAINAVAAALRADGCVVTLSGEGADELFAGYEQPMRSAAAFLESDDAARITHGAFQLLSNAWIAPDLKPAILSASTLAAIDNDDALLHRYDRIFQRVAQEAGAGAEPLDVHLRFHRRVNLTGLLQRLDTSTMLAGVEGRTPFADSEILAIADRMPMRCKFLLEEEQGAAGESASASIAVAAPARTVARTKIALRAAFADRLPAEVIARPKASFPLPFDRWMDSVVPALRASEFAREVFSAAAIETIAADPRANWRLAWPVLNLAMWGAHWWG
ncbi:MAG: asparagine synthase (glutamine-hydrolyzing) [Planctomycetota bacterium]|nr:asparagine synthase (glutamine-hydrolyzing) [Planctomycetota bacterium]